MRLVLSLICVLALNTYFTYGAYNGTCADQSQYGNLTFCDMVDYSMYLAPGESVYSLDRLAQQMFFSKEYGTGGCETEARVLICSNVMRRCISDAPLPPCMSHCTAYTDCAQNDGSCEDMYFDDGATPKDQRYLKCSYIVSAANLVAVTSVSATIAFAIFSLLL